MLRTISLTVDLISAFAYYFAIYITIFNNYILCCLYTCTNVNKELYNVLSIKYLNMLSYIIQSIIDVSLNSVKALKLKFRIV
jgi:hypothetical protein